MATGFGATGEQHSGNQITHRQDIFRMNVDYFGGVQDPLRILSGQLLPSEEDSHIHYNVWYVDCLWEVGG